MINAAYLKGKLEDYCRATLKPGKGKKFVCPVCGDPDGISLYEGGKKWKCFAGKHTGVNCGDIFDLAAIQLGLDRSHFREIAKHICEVLGLAAGELEEAPPEDPAKAKAEEAAAKQKEEKKKADRQALLDKARKESRRRVSLAVISYFDKSRGIGPAELERLRQIPTVEILSLNFSGKDFVLFVPAAENKYIPALNNTAGSYLRRNIKPKEGEPKYINAGSALPVLFTGENEIVPSARVLAVTEGCFDACAFFLSGCSALSLNSVANTGIFQTYLTAIKSAGYAVLIAAADADAAGAKANQEIMNAAAAAGIPCVPLDYAGSPEKDPADLLKNGKTDLLKAAIREAIKAYKKGVSTPAKTDASADALPAPSEPAAAELEKAPAKPDPASNPANHQADEAAAVPSSGEPAKLEPPAEPFKLKTAPLPEQPDKLRITDQIEQVADIIHAENRLYMQGDSLFSVRGHVLQPIHTFELQRALSDIKAASPELCSGCSLSQHLNMLKNLLLTKAKYSPAGDLDAYPTDPHSIACRTHIIELLHGTELRITPKAEYKGRPVRTEAAFSFLPAVSAPPPAFKYFLDSITAGMNPELAALHRLYICLLVAAAAVPWISAAVRALFWVCGQPHTGKTELLKIMREIAGEANCLWVEDSRRLENRFALANIGRAHLALFDDSSAKVNEPVFKQLSQAGGFTSEAKGRNAVTVKHAVAAVCTSNGLPASKNDPAMANRWIYLTVDNVPENPLPDLAERLAAERDPIASWSLNELGKWLKNAPATIDRDKRLLREAAEAWAENYTATGEEIPEFWAEVVQPDLLPGLNVVPIREIHAKFKLWAEDREYKSEYIDARTQKIDPAWGREFKRYAEQKGGTVKTAKSGGINRHSLVIKVK